MTLADPIAPTGLGAVRGMERDGVRCFLGIPYAASPTGTLRFQPPEPPVPWSGVRPAVAFGPTPPKPPYPPPFARLLPDPSIDGDDWLNLNVWTPARATAAPGLPVMVWIPGGGFRNGSSAVPIYDGRTFARDGVVLVSVNYRLGVDGFARLPGAPDNRGLLDQIAALQWVRDNIAGFGGDPANVTVFGESAGAMSITTLLAMPAAEGLFARAITQSGAAQAAAAPADADLVTAQLAAALGRDATAESLAEVGMAELIDAQAAIRDAMAARPDPARFGATIVASLMAFIPVIDGTALPRHPLAAIKAGSGGGIPLLTGTTAEEFRLFLVPTGRSAAVTEEALAAMVPMLGGDASVLATYRANRPAAPPGDLLAAMLTDRYYRLPAFAVASARAAGPAPTFCYEFAWPTPVAGLGACHALDIPFVFDALSASDPLTGPQAPRDLAAAMHAAWIAFAARGDPGWTAFDESYPVQVFGARGGEVVKDPRGDERAAWPQ